jgi:hypothetical protein
VRIAWIVLFGCAARSTEPAVKNAAHAPAPTSLVGHWRVVGCETSPLDPADCGRGEIVFTPVRVMIDVPAADEKSHAYTLVSSSPTRIVVTIDGEVSDITFDKFGAHWRAPGFDGRVGSLSFVRTSP